MKYNGMAASGLGLRGDGLSIQERRLREACRDFEAIFISYLLKVMRESVPQSSLFGDGLGKDIYFSIMDRQMGEEMARRESLGIASMLYRELSKRLTEQIGETPDKITE